MSCAEQALGPEWFAALSPLFKTPEMMNLRAFLKKELENGATIYPRKEHIFRAFKLTPLSAVRIVWLGQDPYHGPAQAEGLSFSVNPHQKIPPSLLNIFKELSQNMGAAMPEHGSLVHWALQGVLLLNTTLTVREHAPLSHQGQGWEFFTDHVIELLAQQSYPICFVLLGQHARSKKSIIHRFFPHHRIIETAHPSPLSAHRGFLGSRIFHQINDFIKEYGYDEICWHEKDFALAHHKKALECEA